MDQKTQQIKQELIEQLISYMDSLDVDRIKGPQEKDEPMSSDIPVDVKKDGEEVEGSEEIKPEMEESKPEQEDEEGLLTELEEMYGKIKG